MKKHTQQKKGAQLQKRKQSYVLSKAWLNLGYAIQKQKQKQTLNKFLQELYAKA